MKNRSFEFTEPLSGWRKPWRPEADGRPSTSPASVAAIDQRNSELILKAVNATPAARKVRVEVKGAGSRRSSGRSRLRRPAST